MTTINIASLGRDIELKPYTRAISRAVNEKLLEGVIVETDALGQAVNTKVAAVNADRSEEVCVRMIAGLTTAEMDTITDEEYEVLKKAVNKATQKKSETTTE